MLYALGVLLCALVLVSSSRVAAGEEATTAASSNAKYEQKSELIGILILLPS